MFAFDTNMDLGVVFDKVIRMSSLTLNLFLFTLIETSAEHPDPQRRVVQREPKHRALKALTV